MGLLAELQLARAALEREAAAARPDASVVMAQLRRLRAARGLSVSALKETRVGFAVRAVKRRLKGTPAARLAADLMDEWKKRFVAGDAPPAPAKAATPAPAPKQQQQQQPRPKRPAAAPSAAAPPAKRRLTPAAASASSARPASRSPVVSAAAAPPPPPPKRRFLKLAAGGAAGSATTRRQSSAASVFSIAGPSRRGQMVAGVKPLVTLCVEALAGKPGLIGQLPPQLFTEHAGALLRHCSPEALRRVCDANAHSTAAFEPVWERMCRKTYPAGEVRGRPAGTSWRAWFSEVEAARKERQRRTGERLAARRQAQELAKQEKGVRFVGTESRLLPSNGRSTKVVARKVARGPGPRSSLPPRGVGSVRSRLAKRFKARKP